MRSSNSGDQSTRPRYSRRTLLISLRSHSPGLSRAVPSQSSSNRALRRRISSQTSSTFASSESHSASFYQVGSSPPSPLLTNPPSPASLISPPPPSVIPADPVISSPSSVAPVSAPNPAHPPPPPPSTPSEAGTPPPPPGIPNDAAKPLPVAPSSPVIPSTNVPKSPQEPIKPLPETPKFPSPVQHQQTPNHPAPAQHQQLPNPPTPAQHQQAPKPHPKPILTTNLPKPHPDTSTPKKPTHIPPKTSKPIGNTHHSKPPHTSADNHTSHNIPVVVDQKPPSAPPQAQKPNLAASKPGLPVVSKPQPEKVNPSPFYKPPNQATAKPTSHFNPVPHPAPKPLPHSPPVSFSSRPIEPQPPVPPSPQASTSPLTSGGNGFQSSIPSPVPISAAIAPPAYASPLSFGDASTIPSSGPSSTAVPPASSTPAANLNSFVPSINATAFSQSSSNLHGIYSGSPSSNALPVPDSSNRLGPALGGAFGGMVGLSAILVAAILATRHRRASKPKVIPSGSQQTRVSIFPSKALTNSQRSNTLNLMVEREAGSTLRSGTLSPIDPVTRYSQGGISLLNRLQGLTSNIGNATSANSPQVENSVAFKPANTAESYPSVSQDNSLDLNNSQFEKPIRNHDTTISLVDPVMTNSPVIQAAAPVGLIETNDNTSSTLTPGSNAEEATRRLLERYNSDDGSIRNPFEHELSSESDMNDVRMSCMSSDFAHAIANSPFGHANGLEDSMNLNRSAMSSSEDPILDSKDSNQILLEQEERLSTPNQDLKGTAS